MQLVIRCWFEVSAKWINVTLFISLSLLRHLLVVFGGLQGLEASVDADQNLDISDPSVLFDLYLNTCPGQGSRTIRTEVRDGASDASTRHTAVFWVLITFLIFSLCRRPYWSPCRRYDTKLPLLYLTRLSGNGKKSHHASERTDAHTKSTAFKGESIMSTNVFYAQPLDLRNIPDWIIAPFIL